jgi:hypothetical protein
MGEGGFRAEDAEDAEMSLRRFQTGPPIQRSVAIATFLRHRLLWRIREYSRAVPRSQLAN